MLTGTTRTAWAAGFGACMLACSSDGDVTPLAQDDMQAEEQSSGGGSGNESSPGGSDSGTQGDPDAATACRSHCDIVEQCPCLEEGPCDETCFEDCVTAMTELDCRVASMNYISCTAAISDPCREGYYYRTFGEECPEEASELSRCVSEIDP